MESAKSGFFRLEFLVQGRVGLAIVGPVCYWCYGGGALEHLVIIIGQSHGSGITSIRPSPDAHMIGINVVVQLSEVSKNNNL